LVEGWLADLKPFFLGLREVEGVGDDLGGFAVVATLEFAMDALFGGGVESDGRGASIAPTCGKTKFVSG
jgi:hypothetical protein